MGHEALEAYTEVKAVTAQLQLTPPFGPPPLRGSDPRLTRQPTVLLFLRVSAGPMGVART